SSARSPMRCRVSRRKWMMWSWNPRNADGVQRGGRAAGSEALLSCVRVVVAVLGCTSPAAAQSVERFTVESVFSIDAFSGENVNDRPQIVVDVSAAMRMGD